MTAHITLLQNGSKTRSKQTCVNGPRPDTPQDPQPLDLSARLRPQEADPSRARLQGLYLAACIIDEVETLQVQDPEWIFTEIRSRIARLVRSEL